ncbi:carbohydrate kinase family protein [Streptomyces sp. NPDC000594]|uniref:carbohydrate kinase family protein n=1 Tax=Streptomyces sp. NPDC000594 TaxID=3154261 RepID=UPI003324C3BA
MDTLVPVGALPVPLADAHPVGPVREQPGQTGGFVALGCRALGLEVTLLDFLGDDWAGRLVRERMAAGGVRFAPLHAPAGTRRAVNLVDPEGRRMSFYDARDPGGTRMDPEVYRPHLRRARHVHLTIMDFARHLLADIRAAGATVSTDLHDWDGAADHHRDFALGADLVFLSSVRTGGGTAGVMRRILAEGRASAVVATAGAEGSWLLVRGGDGTPRRIPAVVPPAPVVDSNGAGDAYVCGFLHAWLAGAGFEECARRGAVTGALACTGQGTDALAGRSGPGDQVCTSGA